MNPWLGKALVLVGIIGTAVIRAPHGRRCGKVRVVESRRNRLEIILLALMWIGMMILPLVSIVTPFVSFADYPLHAFPLFVGAVCLIFGLWLFYRAHTDLGTNWIHQLGITRSPPIGNRRRLRTRPSPHVYGD